jgi:hypothetical protein
VQKGMSALPPKADIRTKSDRALRPDVPAILLDSDSVEAQPKNNRDANAKRSSFQFDFSIGTVLGVPIPRTEACRAKGTACVPS